MGECQLVRKESGRQGKAFDATELWTNPSPTANFAAQTLSLDYSGYEYLWVFSLTDNTCTDYRFNSPYIRGFIINVRTDLSGTKSAFGYASKLEAGYKDDGTYYWFTQRLCTPVATKDTLKFTTGYYVRAKKKSTSMSHGNGTKYCIPYKIFGINRNPRGSIRILNLPLDANDNVITWVANTAAADISLPTGFNYISVEGRQRNERYDNWNWDDCWMSLNITGSTRGGYNPNTTTFVSGIASNIFQKYDTALVQTGYRYESSMDCRRFTQYTYDGTSLKRDESFKCPIYGRKSSGYYSADAPATATGIQRVFGLLHPLWGEDTVDAS